MQAVPMGNPVVNEDDMHLFITCDIPTMDPDRFTLDINGYRVWIEYMPPGGKLSQVKTVSLKEHLVTWQKPRVTFKNGVLDIELDKEKASDHNHPNGGSTAPVGSNPA